MKETKKLADALINTTVKIPVLSNNTVVSIELQLTKNKIVGNKCLSFFKDSTFVCDAKCFLNKLYEVVVDTPENQVIDSATETKS